MAGCATSTGSGTKQAGPTALTGLKGNLWDETSTDRELRFDKLCSSEHGFLGLPLAGQDLADCRRKLDEQASGILAKHAADLRQKRAEEDRRAREERAKRDAARLAALKQRQAAQQADLARQAREELMQEAKERAAKKALRRRCGKYYMRVSVGVRFSKVKGCLGDLHLTYEDRDVKIYQGNGGTIRVEHGVVKAVLFNN